MKLKSTAAFLSLLLMLLPAFAAKAGTGPGVVERPGSQVPLDAHFLDSSGGKVALRELLGRPAVLSLAYFGCRQLCPELLSGLAEALGRLEAAPGRDFVVITVSFDERDGPAEAEAARRGYIKASGRPFPEGSWRFLTGEAEAIESLAAAAGFEFVRAGGGFNHPGALAVLAADGRVTRYFYGSRFLPADLEMALVEAGEGRATASIRKALEYCYALVPEGRGAVLRALKAAGVGVLLFAAVLFIWVNLSPRPRKRDP